MPGSGEDWVRDDVSGIDLVGERLNSCRVVMCIPVGRVHNLVSSKSCAGLVWYIIIPDWQTKSSDPSPSTLSLDRLQPPGRLYLFPSHKP